MPRPSVWILVLVGILAGVFGGTFGAGGGIILVPLFVTVLRFDQRRASATSLLAILPSSIAGGITYLANGEVDLIAAVVIAVGAVVGALLGSALLKRVPLTALTWGFIVLLLLTAVRLVFVEPERGEPIPLSVPVVLAYLAVGLVMGVTSGLFGVGGAVIGVPALVALLGVSDLIAKGTTLAVIVATSVTGSLANRRGGLVDIRTALIVGGVAAVAAVGGSYIGLALPPRLSAVLFAGLLVLTAVQLTVRALRR
ncbi:MAG: sulfite exporter TauE/SafE family protein [Actinobacteria bacterium]|nr:sulfite exporter TauE/SafE family protein [Actinomycetota bacterium]